MLFLAWVVPLFTAPLAQAIPLFARQTGQQCMACHAGGQFPELTPYGRLFKLTGYTLGQRTSVPLSAMAVASRASVANTSKSLSPSTDFQKDDDLILATASLFTGGKITDNVGALVQFTYDPYAVTNADGSFSGHTSADNMDIRWADRFISGDRDLIVGASLNNNPSVSDPWNTSPAWMQYVPVPSPTSYQFIDGAAPYPSYSSGTNIAGLTAYGFLNRTWYGEVGLYGTARGPLSFMTLGVPRTTLRGLNPYWRLAWNHEWGAHNLMIGTGGMLARVYEDPNDPSTIDRYRDWSVDAQYQYLLDPHTVTAQFVYAGNRHRYPPGQSNQAVGFVGPSGQPLANTNAQDTRHLLRAKLSYIYQARYGGSVSLFSLTGTTNTANQTSGFDPTTLTITATNPNATQLSVPVSGNLSGNPGTRGRTLEVFWMPLQYVRIGTQYTMYARYNGASSNYDGFGRNASDNSSLFLYMWMAY